jgi:hypothetical protein
LEDRQIEVGSLVLKYKNGQKDDVIVNSTRKRTYDNLNENEQLKVAAMATTTNTLRMSDKVYARIRRLCPDLPFSSHVKRFLAELTLTLAPISRVPGLRSGGYLNTKTEAINLFNHEVQIGTITEGSRILLKIGGDGTRISKKETGTVYTIAISNEHKPLNIGLTGVVLAKDDYVTMKETAMPLLNECRSVAQILRLESESGFFVSVKWVLGGDMIWLLDIYGLSKPTANFPCLFCHMRKDQFYKGESQDQADDF